MNSRGALSGPVRVGISAVAVVVLVIASVVAALIVRRGSGENTFDPATLSEQLPDVAKVSGQSLAWTGDVLFSYGGSIDGAFLAGDFPFSNEALLIDPATGMSQRLPDPPVEGALEPGSGVVVVDDTVVVVGTLCQRPDRDAFRCPPGTYTALAFSLDAGQWETLELPPGLAESSGFREALGVTSDGRAVFRLGEYRSPTFWTYEPASREWQELPAPSDRVDDQCLAGDQLVVASAKYRVGGKVVANDPFEEGGTGDVSEGDGYVLPSVEVLDLSVDSFEWVRSEEAGGFFIPAATDTVEVACTRAHAILHDDGQDAFTHALLGDVRSGEWVAMPPQPNAGVFGVNISTSEEVVFLSSRLPSLGRVPAQILDPTTNTWRTESDLPSARSSVISAGDSLVGFAQEFDADGRAVTSLVSQSVAEE